MLSQRQPARGEPNALLFTAAQGTDKRIFVVWDQGNPPAYLADFCGERREVEIDGDALRRAAGSARPHECAALRKHLPWTGPQVLGLLPSVGLGDRLGIATPAHIRAVEDTDLAVVLAQQSMREMQRTGRTPDDVMDTATFGVFQENFQRGFGADADHLKTTDDLDVTAAAGFTMFTVDPGDHVDNAAQTDDLRDPRAEVRGPAPRRAGDFARRSRSSACSTRRSRCPTARSSSSTRRRSCARR